MARRKFLHYWFVVLIFAFADCLWPANPANLRLGIIGTDSTHAVEFTRILNDESAPDHVMGARIVAAYRGGNPAFPPSTSFPLVCGITNRIADELNHSTW